MPTATYTIEVLTPSAFATAIDDLRDLLIACVGDGAAIGFLAPLAPEAAKQFWRNRVGPDVDAGRAVFVARAADGRILGTVQLITDMPQNQPHRAEIAKMMVHPVARRRGIGRALMLAALDHARANGKTTVTLDTRTGDVAEPLYAACGFETAGIIPNYAMNTDGITPHATTYMYRILA